VLLSDQELQEHHLPERYLMVSTPSWLRQLLGTDAEDIIEAVFSCIDSAHRDASDAQDAGRLRKRTTYGATFWLSVYDQLIDRFDGMPGATRFHPRGAPYDLVVLNGVLLYPIKVGDSLKRAIRDGRVTDQRIRKGILEMARRYSLNHGFDLAGLVDDEGTEWEELPPIIPEGQVTEILLVPYISNAEAGVLAAGLGQGSLQTPKSITWEHYVDVDLDLYRATPQHVDVDTDDNRFDSAPLPNPTFGIRPVAVDNPEEVDEGTARGAEEEDNGTGD